jgi:hypothetical protein
MRAAASRRIGSRFRVSYTVVKAMYASDTGTITLSPGLKNTAAPQTLKIKGALTECSGEGLTGATYTATPRTGGLIGCPVLKTAGELASGAAKSNETPKERNRAPRPGRSQCLAKTPAVTFSG